MPYKYKYTSLCPGRSKPRYDFLHTISRGSRVAPQLFGSNSWPWNTKTHPVKKALGQISLHFGCFFSKYIHPMIPACCWYFWNIFRELEIYQNPNVPFNRYNTFGLHIDSSNIYLALRNGWENVISAQSFLLEIAKKWRKTPKSANGGWVAFLL